MPNMVVSNALVTTAEGGVARRPDVKVADNLYIVGDEVGKEGLCLIHLLQVQSARCSANSESFLKEHTF